MFRTTLLVMFMQYGNPLSLVLHAYNSYLLVDVKSPWRVRNIAAQVKLNPDFQVSSFLSWLATNPLTNAAIILL